MDIETALLTALHNATLNTTALDLLIANGVTSKHFTTSQKVGLGMFLASAIGATVGLRGLWLRLRIPVYVVVSVLMAVIALGFHCAVRWQNGKILAVAFDDWQLEGDTMPLDQLISGLYSSGLRLAKLSYDSFEDGVLLNYSTQVLVAGARYFNEMTGRFVVDVAELEKMA